jgi:hypothetical protein
MLAFDLTPWNLFGIAVIAWAVWMCVVVVMFMARGGSKAWQEQEYWQRQYPQH